jgi:hypothetical protein
VDTKLKPGDWTPTGWGAQHRIRWTQPKNRDRVVVLVCHGDKPGDYALLSRMNTQATENKRCNRCEVIPDLGPMWTPTLFEVRRDPATGMVAACVRTWDGRVPTSPVDTCWLILEWGTAARGPAAAQRVDSYAVVAWDVTGTVPGLALDTYGAW